MKRTIIMLLAFLPMTLMAQGNWERSKDALPQTEAEIKAQKQQDAIAKKAAKKERKHTDPKYLMGGAPMVDGRVQWTLELDVPGKTAAEVYEKTYACLLEITKGENQLHGSQIALVNETEHSIVATIREWLLFKKNAISIDRADTSYKLFANCRDGHLQLTLTRIVFDYRENVKDGIYKAEERISDEEALNKKGTKIYPGSVKFRKKMIDRKDEIFAFVTERLGKIEK